MNEITKEVKNILLNNADVCIDEHDEFHPPDKVLDEMVLARHLGDITGGSDEGCVRSSVATHTVGDI